MTPRTDAIIISSGSSGEVSQMTQFSAASSPAKVSVMCASSFSASWDDIIRRHCWYIDAIE
jgi:hypothetical protein